jgi:outer membrane protein TolC
MMQKRGCATVAFGIFLVLLQLPVSNGQEQISLSVDRMIKLILDHNESVQVRLLEAEIGQKTVNAERGIFEPQITGSVEHVDSTRPNNSQQLASLGFSATPFLTEQNTLYNGGLEFLTPIGTKVRTGVTFRDLHNNIQQNGAELETFLGATVTQPLLKNFGVNATMARIRLAATASDIAFQEYRKQMMLVISQAESAYWDLYLMQEQQQISSQSVETATKIFRDSEARKDVGRGAQMDVLQAAASVSQRQAKLGESKNRVMESISRLTSYFFDTTVLTNAFIRASDTPAIDYISLDQMTGAQEAFLSNPDYLIREHRLKQDDIRLAYAKNQRLPQVDLKGAYGVNGLGRNINRSLDMADDLRAPVWSVGLELNIPLAGGIKERNELAAAKLGRTRSKAAVEEAGVQIASALAAALSKVRTYQDNLTNHIAAAKNLEDLLNAQIARFEAGSLENRWVLESIDKLAEARSVVIEDRVNYRRALLELELIRGATLKNRNVEVTKGELQSRTRALLADRRLTGKDIDAAQKKAQTEFEKQYAQ